MRSALRIFREGDKKFPGLISEKKLLKAIEKINPDNPRADFDLLVRMDYIYPRVWLKSGPHLMYQITKEFIKYFRETQKIKIIDMPTFWAMKKEYDEMEAEEEMEKECKDGRKIAKDLKEIYEQDPEGFKRQINATRDYYRRRRQFKLTQEEMRAERDKIVKKQDEDKSELIKAQKKLSKEIPEPEITQDMIDFFDSLDLESDD